MMKEFHVTISGRTFLLQSRTKEGAANVFLQTINKLVAPKKINKKDFEVKPVKHA